MNGSFSPDGSRLALRTYTFKEKNTIVELSVVDTKTGKLLRRQPLPEHSGELWLLGDNRTAVFCDPDDTVSVRLRTLDTQTGKVLRTWQNDNEWYRLGGSASYQYHAALSPDHKLIAFATTETGIDLYIHILDTETLTERVMFTWKRGFSVNHGVPEPPTAMAISPDNKTLAVGVDNGTIILYDIPPQAKKPNPK